MATSQYDRYGVLHNWRIHMQENVWRFNQIDGQGVRNVAEPVYIQPDRDALARALTEAWQLMSTRLAYFPQPTWHSERIRFGAGVPYWLQSLTTTYRKLIQMGRRATALIEAGVAVTYSDADGDGVNDTATITVLNTTIDADEIQLFVQVADGASAAGDFYWRIHPVTVTKSGTTATITGHRALFVKPSVITNIPYDPTDPNSLERNNGNSTNAAHFVTAVDVYRVYNDPTSPVDLVADPIYSQSPGYWNADITYAGQGWIEDGENGIIRLRHNASCPGAISYATVHYQSGIPLVNGLMDSYYGLAMSRLANTLTPHELNCPFTTWTKDRYVADRSIGLVEGENPSAHPFGRLNGQIFAWQFVANELAQVVIGGKW